MKYFFSYIPIVILCVLYSLVAHLGWKSTCKATHARDFATYYYAYKVTQNPNLHKNENFNIPYQTKNLTQLARKEGTRKSVHPFFYPPPSLLFFSWTQLFSLESSYQIFYVFNQICFGFILVLCKKWFRFSWLSLLFCAVTFTPINNAIIMGQINVLVVLFLMIAIRYNNGVLLACAGMIKMSPVYIMFHWIAQRELKPVLWTIISAIILSLFSLVFIDMKQQLFFYSDILPSFSSGNYNGLRIPITLPANHSIPDILNQIIPGPNNKTLDPLAQKISGGISLFLLVFMLGCSWKWRGPRTAMFLSGAFITLFVITPIYTYEHHLAFVFLPIVFLGSAVETGEIHSRLEKTFLMCIYFFLAWPLWMLRSIQNDNEIWNWILQESKFFALIGLMIFCLYQAYITREREHILE